MDKITIIIPCFNEQDVLEALYKKLQSVIATVYDCQFTYLFINDGSRDETLDILRELQGKDRKDRKSVV